MYSEKPPEASTTVGGPCFSILLGCSSTCDAHRGDPFDTATADDEHPWQVRSCAQSRKPEAPGFRLASAGTHKKAGGKLEKLPKPRRLSGKRNAMQPTEVRKSFRLVTLQVKNMNLTGSDRTKQAHFQSRSLEKAFASSSEEAGSSSDSASDS